VQVICKDGTTIQCEDFEATDSGVLFYQEASGRQEGESEDEKEERHSASGFVPVTELRFVLPDEMVQRQARARQAGVPQGAPSGGMQAPQQATQQQQMQSAPGMSQQQPREHGGQQR